jgi:transposase
LLHDASGPVYLVLDGSSRAPGHGDQDLRRLHRRQLRLFFLPGYSPELNPDEWVWKNVKHDRVGRAGITTAADLKAKATGALRLSWSRMRPRGLM